MEKCHYTKNTQGLVVLHKNWIPCFTWLNKEVVKQNLAPVACVIKQINFACLWCNIAEHHLHSANQKA